MSNQDSSKVVKLDSLNTHTANDKLDPSSCLNSGCKSEINGRDEDTYENQPSDNRRVKSNNEESGETCSCSAEDSCPRKEIRELKADLAKFRSLVENEVFTEVRKLTSTVGRIEGNFTQPSGNSSRDSRAEIVVSGGEGIKSTIVLNVASGIWRRLAATYECEGASSVMNKDHMLLTGGSVGHLTDIVKQLEPSQHNAQWVESQIRLPFPCRGHTTVLYENSLFVFGGLTECQDLAMDTVHEISLIPPSKPELVCKLPEAKCYHGAAVVNGNVYIVGGCEQYANTATDAVIKYEPASKACTKLNPLPYGVSGMAIAIWLNKLLVIGGLNKQGGYLDSVIMYDVSTQRHHILPKMQKKRAYCTAVVVDNKLIVMGGADERSSRLSSVESYDFQTYTWADMTPMDEPRAYATAAVHDF